MSRSDLAPYAGLGRVHTGGDGIWLVTEHKRNEELARVAIAIVDPTENRAIVVPVKHIYCVTYMVAHTWWRTKLGEVE